MRESYPVWPWVVFYLLYAAVMLRLVVLPLPDNASPALAGFNGALLGVAAYGAYNMTNYAILASWPLSITLKDWAWGTFVSGAIALAGFLFQRSALLRRGSD